MALRLWMERPASVKILVLRRPEYQFWRLCLLIVVVDRTHSQIRNERISNPLLSTVLRHITGTLRSSNPGELVQGRITAKSLAARVGSQCIQSSSA